MVDEKGVIHPTQLPGVFSVTRMQSGKSLTPTAAPGLRQGLSGLLQFEIIRIQMRRETFTVGS